MPNFGDPSTLFRLLIVAFSAISVILLVAGTALDEYVSVSSGGMEATFGCQKSYDTLSGLTERASYKSMRTLQFVLMVVTSALCLLQAIATALNALVLARGTNPTPALIVTSAVTVLLLAAIIIANVHFTTANNILMTSVVAVPQAVPPPTYPRGNPAQFAANNEIKPNDVGGRPSHNYGINLRSKRSTYVVQYHRLPLEWTHSYALLCAAFSFAVINQFLLLAIHQMSKSGVSTFLALVYKIVACVTDGTWITRFCITWLNGLLLILMVTGTAIDRYYGTKDCAHGTRLQDCLAGIYYKTFQEMPTLAFVLLIVTCLVCVLLVVAFILCILLLKKDTPLSIPLLVLSVLSTALLLASVVLASVKFTKENYYPWTNNMVHKHSFISLCISFAFSIVNTALNILNIVFSKRGGSGSGYSPLDTASTQSTGGIPSQPSQPSQPSSSYADPQLSSK